MQSSSFLFPFISLLFFPLSFASPSYFTSHSLCRDDEGSALLQFKKSLTINACDPSDPYAYPKLESWELKEEGGNCCSWDGVLCDNITAHVIGLDLSSSCLCGSLNSNSSLFQLVHLRYLNLAHNNFSRSQIPSRLGHLSQLTYLNLSTASFSGPIPATISQLSKLITLSLSKNDGLMVTKQDLGGLVQNFTALQHLILNYVDISSTVPESLANLSSLSTLLLLGCGLYGQFPEVIFQLPSLQFLALSSNENLKGQLPQFNSSSLLQELIIWKTSFNGKLPTSIGQLRSLTVLDIEESSFQGQVPTSLGNLTQLRLLALAHNSFERHNTSTFSWLGKQAKLTGLYLSGISFNAEIPTYLANLTHLAALDLSFCHFTGSIPSWLFEKNQLRVLLLSINDLQGPIPSSISQSTQISWLGLSSVNLQGEIPSSIFRLKNLESLDLSNNNLSGTVELDNFLRLEKLTTLMLSGNVLSLLHKPNAGSTVRQFSELGLGSCNLLQFPDFLQDQDELTFLDLSNNNIHGQVPKWIWNSGRETLEFINLSDNFLTDFELQLDVLPWEQAVYISLAYNNFQGRLPLPPPSSQVYFMSNNNWEGQISLTFCSIHSLRVLDLSNNNLGGELPECLGNFSFSMQSLNLQGNNFQGKIPQTHTKECNLRILRLDDNKLEGEVPKSLINCTKLKLLSLGNNRISDAFPSWLGALGELKVLVLRSNRFQGALMRSHDQANFGFPSLQIIDLSWNNFSGRLPSQFFINWNGMKVAEDLKGKFQGSFGDLKGLRLLNLSNNVLAGLIPSALGNLSKLEALDLSQNNLRGNIPQELARLNFLSFFNVSSNHLIGPIPSGNQFDTFQNDSYMGNSGLCGNPLSKTCADTRQPSSSEGEGHPFMFGWEPVAIGYACGFAVGIAMGHCVYTKKLEWIVKVFGEKRRMGRVVMGIRRWN